MATAKKKPAAKTPVTKKVTKSTATRKPATKKQVVAKPRSFRPTQEKTPFMTFKFTRQSFYWLILSTLVLALGSWVMHLNVQIQNIYDDVERNTYLHDTYTIPQKSPATPAPVTTE